MNNILPSTFEHVFCNASKSLYNALKKLSDWGGANFIFDVVPEKEDLDLPINTARAKFFFFHLKVDKSLYLQNRLHTIVT